MGSVCRSGAGRRMFTLLVASLAGAVGMTGCGGGEVELPAPRPIIVTSGERLRVEPERMDSIYAWLSEENQNIEEDPSFLIEGVPAARESLPWQTITINAKGDTARFQYDRAHPDITTAFNVYAHLHLMKRQNRLAEWLPDHASEEGYELEHAIVSRMADAWLLGRAVFDAPAYRPLDQLIYAKEAGYLEAYLLTARAADFPEDRQRWEAANPGKLEEYKAWFRRTFNSDPPGAEATGQG